MKAPAPQPGHRPEDHAREFGRLPDHDWLAAVARKIRTYGRHPTEQTAALTLDSLCRMADAYRLARRLRP